MNSHDLDDLTTGVHGDNNMRQGFHWMQEDMIQKEQFLSEEVYLPRDFV